MPRYIGRSLDSTINISTRDQHWSNVSLLLRMDGSDASTTFTDSSDTARTFTANGNAQIDTAQSKFGGASGLFDGTGDYITAPNSADFQFGSGDFTIENWIRLNAVGQFHEIANQMTNSARGWMYDVTSGNKLRLYGFISSWQELGISTTSLTTGQWYHCAVTREGTSFRLFLDGVLEDTTVISGAFTEENSTPFTVGYIGDGSLSRYMNGWIDDLRITKGVARYTANFSVPDALSESTGGTGHTDNKYNSGIWSISGGGDDSINTRRRSGKWGTNIGSVLSRVSQYQFLIVGGGGSGGGKNYHAAGGGAGGMLTGTLGVGPGETLTVTVGAGGAAASTSTQGNAGATSVVSNPVLGTHSALGGGGGGRGYGPSGAPGTRDGGSGGGGGGNSGASMTSESYLGGDGTQTAPSPAWTAYGNDGGDNQYGTSQNPYGGGGGGGAGAVGGHAGPNGVAGAGGAGYASSITGSSVTYAGGGGGSAYAANGGAGGSGGGGQGEGNQGSAINGTANLGGGGGGNDRDGNAGAGGSGVVIIRMLTPKYTGTISGTTTVTTSGGDTIVKFTAPGTLLT